MAKFTSSELLEKYTLNTYGGDINEIDTKAWTGKITELPVLENDMPDNVTIIFKNDDGSIISRTQYNYGDIITIPSNPTKAGYEFKGWSPTVNPTAVANAVYTATYSTQYNLKFTAVEPSTLELWRIGAFETEAKLFKSADNSTWESWPRMSTISLDTNESVYIKGDNPNGLSEHGTKYYYFRMTGKMHCTGNIMSLLGENVTEIPCQGCFLELFSYYCPGLLSAPILPATKLTKSCYGAMFYGCSSLTTAPELPATALTEFCYESMFEGCSSLTTAPKLPATVLTENCYAKMFQKCTSLATAPELPATKLEPFCYIQMFYQCPNINYIKANFIKVDHSNAIGSWLSGTSPTGTFVKNPDATWETAEIPSGWSITT